MKRASDSHRRARAARVVGGLVTVIAGLGALLQAGLRGGNGGPGRIAAPWVDRRAPSGLFVDPITGGRRHGYGPAMPAEALIREGVRRDDRRLLRAGLRALGANSVRAAADGKAGNPLELYATVSAYRWAERHLGRDAGWRRFASGSRRCLR